MAKFDKSCGLTKNQVAMIKFAIKRNIESKLPILPEYIETKLFFQGRDAWIYSWELQTSVDIDRNMPILLAVTVKLKREFHSYEKIYNYNYLCTVRLTADIYNPKISLKQINC
jgi:hypothetical protein